MNYLIFDMSEVRKIIQNAFRFKVDSHDLIKSAQSLLTKGERNIIYEFLELGHLPVVNNAISKSSQVDEWLELILQLINKSNYNIYTLINQRAIRYNDKPLFQTISNNKITPLSYTKSWAIIQSIGSYFQSNLKDNNTIGLYSQNNLRNVLIDLACLSYNIRVVPIPMNLSSDHFEYVIKHAEITHLFLDSSITELSIRDINRKKNDIMIIDIDNDQAWDQFLSQCDNISIQKPLLHDLNELSSVMYTSGTTDNPKGIIFNQTNIISKRFARALALPDIGPDDSFLCYLPLYHTFGRWFEMMGSIFWGTTYTFTETTSFKNLLKDFELSKPSIFISIPKRWIQIYEQIEASIDIEKSNDNEINKITRSVTGGNLKWGLSAAGYLDPDLFRFFNDNGINLLSGYGMTEATGGITMTPPSDYYTDSVGKPLPGIELKLAEDNELLMRGPYVSSGYYKEEIKGSFTDGWFHTGDIFRKKKSHYFIVDRKKEIYKNSRGQTISPQKIENLFQDFEAIKSVFLIGDGKEFNTVLIYPDLRNDIIDLDDMSQKEIRTYFSSLVFSVNSFLPSYERIVNYAIIQRDFVKDKNEITSKNTFKRKKILENFSDIIDPMYEKSHISLIKANHEIRIPNWLLREKSITRRDINWDGKKIREYELKEGLRLEWTTKSLIIGDYIYKTSETIIDLEKILRDPTLWIGNKSLIEFTGEVVFRVISFEDYHTIVLDSSKLPFNKNIHPLKQKTYKTDEYNISLLHQASIDLLHKKKKNIQEALKYLKIGLSYPKYKSIIQEQLLRIQYHPDQNNWILALDILIPHISGEMFIDLFKKSKNQKIINSIDMSLIEDHHLQSIILYLTDLRSSTRIKKGENLTIKLLVVFLTELGIKNPKYFSTIRGELTLWINETNNLEIKKVTRRSLTKLNKNFRKLIEIDSSIEGFNWERVLQFDKNISADLVKTLKKIISESSVICESIFIFSKGDLIQLKDILENGIWCTLIGEGHGKYVIRVLVQLKDKKAYNFVINVNHALNKTRFSLETNWLIMLNADVHSEKLVEDFGSFWPEYKTFSEEYISSETVFQYLTRKQKEISSKEFQDRWQMRWLHFIWNSVAAYLEFWKRSSQTRMIKDSSTQNLIIPQFDYYTGTRLISISGRSKTTELSDVLITLYKKLILDTEDQFPGLIKMAEWEILFTVVLEIFGTTKGFRLLNNLKNQNQELGLTKKRVNLFIKDVKEFGLLRKQVVFASLRYQRWLDLNNDATYEARGEIILDLYKDYNLQSLIEQYPETRLRFFLMTVFKDSNNDLKNKLNQLMILMRSGSITDDILETYLHQIHEEIELSKAEKYFLTRLVFEHVDAADYAELITRDIGDKGLLELAINTKDSSGKLFTIRPAFHPKEIARFHRLLLEEKLDVKFESHHQFLLTFDQKNNLVGGVFWKKTSHGIAHLEKIAISKDFQKKHLSIKLIEELYQRLKIKKYKYLTVGFFKSELFYNVGFEINQKFGGLVKHL